MGWNLLGSGESNIKTSRIIEEADPLVFIRSDTGQDDEVFLPTLERVNTGYLNLLKYKIKLETMHEKRSTMGVRSDQVWQKQACIVAEAR